MASEQNGLKHVLLAGLFVIIGALITGAATVWAAQSGNLPEGVMPTATATVTVTATQEPNFGSNAPVSAAPSTPSRWVAEIEPLTEEGYWQSGQAEIRGRTYLHSLTISTETGDDTGTSWRQYALDEKYAQLSGVVGIADGGHNTEEANFQILVDDRVAFEKQIKIGETPAEVNLDVSGANDLRLQVTDIDNSAFSSRPVFAEFELE